MGWVNLPQVSRLLVKYRQNFAWVCITMVILVTCLLMGKKATCLRQIRKILKEMFI